jgi:hypothetical protein
MEERTKPRLFDSDSELEALLAAFDEARIPRHLWTHREHLAVATLYVLQQRGLDAIRSGIQRLNEANGVPQTPNGGYHETVTVVWMKLIGDRVGAESYPGPLVAVNDILDAFGDKHYLLAYYSRDRINSVEARYGWVEPDIKGL